MASLQQLTDEVCGWLNRKDVLPLIPGWVSMVETELAETLRARCMVTSGVQTIDSAYIALPADFATMESIRDNISGELLELRDQWSGGWTDPHSSAWRDGAVVGSYYMPCKAYRLVHDCIEFLPHPLIPDPPDPNWRPQQVLMGWYQKPRPLLLPSDTNPILEQLYGVYLFGLCKYGAMFELDDDRVQQMDAAWQQAITRGNLWKQQSDYSGAPYRAEIAVRFLMVMVITRASKHEARYTPAGGREHCSLCRFYNASGACLRIIGPVSVHGWCKYFSREMVQQNQSATFGGGGISVSLDLTQGVLPSAWTFSRGSPATYIDATGTMQTAGNNVPRFDYDPVTRQPLGLLHEGAGSNLLLNSATLTTQSVAVTAQPYVLSFYGAVAQPLWCGRPAAASRHRPSCLSRLAFTPTAGSLTLTVTGPVQNAHRLEAGPYATSYIRGSRAPPPPAPPRC